MYSAFFDVLTVSIIVQDVFMYILNLINADYFFCTSIDSYPQFLLVSKFLYQFPTVRAVLKIPSR
jgi:hypothetical protein